MLEKELNKAQKQAVEHTDGPLLIVAGAGTGKTTVITEKISYLIKKGLSQPENILALTFTEKAAEEMEERVDQMLDVGYLDMQISTFHAFCQRLLEQYGMDIGLPTGFKIMSDTDAWLLVRKYIYNFNLDYYRPLGNPAKHIHNLLKHFSKCKDELVSPEEYLDYAEGLKIDKDAIQEDEKDRLTEIANAYHKYNQLLLDNDALDFGDLIFYTFKLLEKRPAILKQIQERFKYILVDEFQDVNYAQYELVKKLVSNRHPDRPKGVEGSRGKEKKQRDPSIPPADSAGSTRDDVLGSQLTVVGDDDQSIYAFRGASVSNIMRFKEDYPKAKEIVLTKNYRSGQEILDLAYKSVKHNDPDRLEVKLGIDKGLESMINDQRSTIEHIHTSTVDDEVQTVIEKIREISKQKSVVLDDVAILVRANNHAEPFLNGLEQAGIPYEYISSQGLYRQPIVLDIFYFLKLIDNYHESNSIYRLLRLPLFEFTENDMQNLTHMAKKKSISYYEALKRAGEFKLSKQGIEVCENLVNLIHNGMRKARYEKPTAVIYQFLEESGYLNYLTGKEEEGDRNIIHQIYQLKQFFDFVNSFETGSPDATVASFLDHFEEIISSGDEGKLYQPTDTPDSVNVMTIHGAKGLEFKYVFLVNMVEDRFPTRRRGDVIEMPEDLIKEVLPEGDYHLQEERRLFYVGMTRAKEKLFFTSADNYGGVRKKKLSRFLVELDFDDGLRSTDYGQKSVAGYGSRVSGEKNIKAGFVYELPKTFSFSQIRAFQNCKYQYKLAYILKIPMKGSPYFSFGNAMHATMQKFYERIIELNSAQQGSLFGLPKETNNHSNIKVPTFDELQEIYKKCWISDWFQSKKQREGYYKKGKDILKEFYESNDGKWTVPVGLESYFKIKMDKYFVTGRIDRIDTLESGGLEIIDYKTGKSKEKLSGEDKDQLMLYEIAMGQLPQFKNLGEVEKLTYYYLNDNLKTSFESKEKGMDILEEKIIKTSHEIHETDFNKIGKKDMCGRCDFCKMAGDKPI